LFVKSLLYRIELFYAIGIAMNLSVCIATNCRSAHFGTNWPFT